MRINVGHFEPKSHYVQAAAEAIAGGFLSYNKYSKAFEEAFAEKIGVKHAVVCASGTDALRISLHAIMELEEGELLRQGRNEVIVPASTFVATVNIVKQLGLTPIFADIDDTWTMDVESLNEVYSDRTLACIPVHLFGQMANMAGIYNYIDPDSTYVIEDTCEAMGSRLPHENPHWNHMAGGLGDMGCFSLYVAHHITSGSGGVITTENKALALLARSLANHGRQPTYYSTEHRTATMDDPESRFTFDLMGYSSRIPEPMVAMAHEQLKELDDTLSIRRTFANHLRGQLGDLERSEKLRLQGGFERAGHSHMMFPMMILDGNRGDFMRYLEQHDIETRTALPLLNQPCYRNTILDGLSDEDLAERYPKAWELTLKGLYVGCHPGLTVTDIDYMADVIHDYFK